MRLSNYLKFIAAVGISELAGIIGAFFTTPAIQSGWYADLTMPLFTPPSWIFGPVWITLYFLIGISLYLAWKNNWKTVNQLFDEGQNKKAWNPWSERLWRGDWQKVNVIAIFIVQYVLNIVWSFVFFGLHMPDVAFFIIIALWFAILSVVFNFYIISRSAAWLLLPYLLWVSFAIYLNYAIWALN